MEETNERWSSVRAHFSGTTDAIDTRNAARAAHATGPHCGLGAADAPAPARTPSARYILVVRLTAALFQLAR